METRTVLVIGSGTMGSGIAQVCAQAGITVFLYDVDSAYLEKSFKSIEWSVGKLAEKGKLEEDKDVVMGRIQACRDMQAAAAVDLVIEAVFENIDVKKSDF